MGELNRDPFISYIDILLKDEGESVESRVTLSRISDYSATLRRSSISIPSGATNSKVLSVIVLS